MAVRTPLRAVPILVLVLGLAGCAPPAAGDPDDRAGAAREEAAAGTGGRSDDRRAAPAVTVQADATDARAVSTAGPAVGGAGGPAPDGSTAGSDGAVADDRSWGTIQTAVDTVFDRKVLHRITIDVAAQHVKRLESKVDERVPCTFTFDGKVLKEVGIRQSGGSFLPARKLNDKPSFSVKFDEFVKGQELHGLDKLIIKNEFQDWSLVNEHMTYEIFRRAGLPSRETAHAEVIVNGVNNGIHLLREAVDKKFLVRTLGKGNEKGNLYEIDFFRGGDFTEKPNDVKLDDEKEEMRSRADLLAFATAVRASTSATYESVVSQHLDLDRYITYYAVEGVTSYLDGFDFNNNNTYMYAHPRDGRFILLPHGADQAFWATDPKVRLTSALQGPKSTLSRKLRAVPALDARFKAEVMRVSSPPVWDVQALLARVNQVAEILKVATKDGRPAVDVASFEKQRPAVEAFIKAGGLAKGTAGLLP